MKMACSEMHEWETGRVLIVYVSWVLFSGKLTAPLSEFGCATIPWILSSSTLPCHLRFYWYNLVNRVLPKRGKVLCSSAVPKFGTQEGFRIDPLQISTSAILFSSIKVLHLTLLLLLSRFNFTDDPLNKTVCEMVRNLASAIHKPIRVIWMLANYSQD